MCRGARYCLDVALAGGTRGKIAFVRRMPKMRQLIELLRGTFLHYTFRFFSSSRFYFYTVFIFACLSQTYEYTIGVYIHVWTSFYIVCISVHIVQMNVHIYKYMYSVL